VPVACADDRVTIGCLPFCLVPVVVGTAVVATQTDVGKDILEGIPGSSVVAKGIQALITGPLKDFAGTPVGKMVLRAVATAAYMSGVGWVGPQLAALAFALPGLARGEGFAQAWVGEFVWRVEKLAEIMGASEAKQIAIDQAKGALSKLWEEYGGDQAIEQLWRQYGQERFDGLVSRLASKFEIREDAVAAVISGLLGIEPAPRAEWFDPLTGKFLPAVSRFSPYEAASTAIHATFTRTALPYGGRMQTAGSSAFLAAGTYRPAAAPAPVLDRLVAPAPPPPSSSSEAGRVALVASLGAAAAAYVWFFVGKP
jgi:hypothetical protein